MGLDRTDSVSRQEKQFKESVTHYSKLSSIELIVLLIDEEPK